VKPVNALQSRRRVKSSVVDALFKLLGVLVGCYAVYGLANGAIYAKYRWGGRVLRRDADTLGFWSAIAAYGALAGMLIFLF
jgi:uncharacterized RDD family membrane protein YckC